MAEQASVPIFRTIHLDGAYLRTEVYSLSNGWLTIHSVPAADPEPDVEGSDS